MIIKEPQLKKIINEWQEFLGILIYGPNEGLVREQVDKIIKEYLKKKDCEIVNIVGKELDAAPELLNDTIKTVSMFHENKIVIIEHIKDKHLGIVEEIITDNPQQIVIILREGNLNKSSKIRKFFESNKKCYSLACYEDDSRSIIQNIDNFIKKNNIEFSQDIKHFLLQTLSNDRIICKQELEKIDLFYSKSSEKIELENIKKLLNDSSTQNLSKMNESVMFGNASKSSKIVSKLLSEGTNSISILRSLINYLLRIQQTKIEMKKGNNFASSIMKLKPPVFWKDKDNFEKHCLKWPLQSIESNLNKLLETEIRCKLNSKLANLNCEKSILLIANNGRQYFKN